MLFALVLGVLVGGAAVLLLEQWLRDVLGGGERPVRVFTPTGSFILRPQAPGGFERKRAA
jgi:hypothetical protein